MRHRFHSICPYFAMFPEAFVEKHLAASKHSGVVFDPFCGRGTTVFESLIRGRTAAGCDVHPVAVCVSGAKSDPPTKSDVAARLAELEEACPAQMEKGFPSELEEFFALCFEQSTLTQVAYLRSTLRWRTDCVDRFIAALSLGALHGESHRSPSYFSNRMPRTISTKPAYSIRWWRRHGCEPPQRDVFEILRRANVYRFRTPPPKIRGEIAMSDARQASDCFTHLIGRVSDVITSPPYLDTTNYREDQWLRIWFLGGDPSIQYQRDDGRQYNAEKYWAFLGEAWHGIGPLLADEARIVVRIGGRKLTKEEARGALTVAIADGTGRLVELIDTGVTSELKSSQANTFRGSKPSSTVEHDFCFSIR